MFNILFVTTKDNFRPIIVLEKIRQFFTLHRTIKTKIALIRKSSLLIVMVSGSLADLKFSDIGDRK